MKAFSICLLAAEQSSLRRPFGPSTNLTSSERWIIHKLSHIPMVGVSAEGSVIIKTDFATTMEHDFELMSSQRSGSYDTGPFGEEQEKSK